MGEATVTEPAGAGGAKEPRIRVTLSNISVYPRKAPFAFEIAAELGYDGLEIMVLPDTTTKDARALNRLAADHGQPVTSIHAPSLVLSQGIWGRLPGPKLERSVDLALEVGAEVVVVHPPFRWQRRYSRGFVDHVRALSEATGVVVAVENMYPWRNRKREMVRAYLPGWDPTEHDYDHVTLDLSHAAVARQDSRALARQFGPRLRHIHLADGTASMMDEHLVPGRGTQPARELLSDLVGSGWSGDVCVEISTRRANSAAERYEDVAASLKFARTYLSPGPHADYTPPEGAHHRHLDAW
ncbi:sugar phosphate isomerase/epimerase family protein [Occultella kanbiaonis]|uniref:sugar phosphate isomerase/epimerase family protein n=1 Tax=Occultella kanbiaonis TaxID=2675754 RepID=UPI0013D36D74|nr:sugar phosphate isomerase/epimerase [Occultella kanbiaonis]